MCNFNKITIASIMSDKAVLDDYDHDQQTRAMIDVTCYCVVKEYMN